MSNRLSINLIAFLCLILAGFLTASLAAEVDGPRGPHESRPAKLGDFCIRCGINHEHINTVLQHKGRWLAVCPPCQEFVMANIDSFDYYFDKLEPRGALFQEHDGQISESSFSWGWFLLGLFILMNLITGALAATIAFRKGQPVGHWFFVGLVANIFGVGYAMMQPEIKDQKLPDGLHKMPTTSSPVYCNNCGAQNHPSAKTCSSCGIALTPGQTSDVERLG